MRMYRVRLRHSKCVGSCNEVMQGHTARMCAAWQVLVQHCGVVLHYADGRTLAATENSSAVHIGDDSPKLLRSVFILNISIFCDRGS